MKNTKWLKGRADNKNNDKLLYTKVDNIARDTALKLKHIIY